MRREGRAISAEAAVLHAVIEGDHDQASELLRDFLPGELQSPLQRALDATGDLIAAEESSRIGGAR